MAIGDGRAALRRDARELARTPPADPYRGTLSDPFVAPVEPADAAPIEPAEAPGPSLLLPDRGVPTQATLAGILAIALGVTTALFGMLLLAVLGLQNDYGAPDRSYYRGTDSGYLVLALVDFMLAAGCTFGGIAFLTGRLTGRIALTMSGWGLLVLSAFWFLRGEVNSAAPVIVALAAATMLVLAYHRRVTRWLGILPSPQPS